MTAPIAAAIAAVILSALAVFQLALAAGAPLGRFAWGGGRRVLNRPFRIASVIAAAIYMAVAILMLEAAGVIDLIAAGDVVRVAMWVVTAVLGLGVLMNAISRSAGERAVMTPVALSLALLAAVVAIQGSSSR